MLSVLALEQLTKKFLLPHVAALNRHVLSIFEISKLSTTEKAIKMNLQGRDQLLDLQMKVSTSD